MSHLKPETLVEMYKEIQSKEGRASCDMLSEKLAGMGIVSPRTQLPYTRQNIRHLMGKLEEGRKLLENNIRNTGVAPHLSPAVIDTNHHLTSIIRNKFPTCIILRPNDLQLESRIQGRDVYICEPISLAKLAGSLHVHEYNPLTDSYNTYTVRKERDE